MPHARHFSGRSAPLGLCFLLLALPARSAPSQELENPEALKLPSPWVPSFDTHLWAGYKDNVLLGSQNLEASPFVAGGLDITLFRVPVDGWEFLFLSSAEYV